jgi:hypothetical protein
VPMCLTAPLLLMAKYCDPAKVKELHNTKRTGDGEQTLQYSNTSAKEDNSFRVHIVSRNLR